jgi:cbb3-type cytochrome oxidase maturation protein
MEILYLLIGVSLVIVGGIVAVLLWAVRSGQFEDLEGPAFRILADDDRPPGRASPREGGDRGSSREPRGPRSGRRRGSP